MRGFICADSKSSPSWTNCCHSVYLLAIKTFSFLLILEILEESSMTIIYSALCVEGTSSVGLEALCRANGSVGVK